MRHFFSAKVRVVLILAVVLAIALTVIGSLTGLAIPDMLVQGVLTPLRTGVSRLRDGAEQYYSYMFRYEALEAENAALKEELANLQADARSADSLARENERLRDALNMLATHEDYDLVDSYIIARNSVDWNSTLTINRGKNAGIEEGMCAITANHELVGVVSEVGSNYAVIKTIMDSSLQISASLSSTGNNGQVRGSYTSGHEDLLRRMLLEGFDVNTSQLGALFIPAMVIWGGQDALLGGAIPKRLKERDFPAAEYHVLPNSGHCAMETASRAVCDFLRGWIREMWV
jgi:rod shape-determining protein MreC